MRPDDAVRQKEKEQALQDAVWLSATSGGGTGALVGAASSLLSGKRKLADYLVSSLVGGAGGAGISGGSVYTGGELLGVSDDPGAYTRKGGLGGLALGGAVGGTLGAIAGAGSLKYADKALDFAPKGFAEGARNAFHSNTDNLMGDYFKKLAKGPKLAGALKGGLLGGVAVGGLASFLGSDEGMQVDYINSELERYNKAKLKRELLDGQL